jgi:hypothetical protein
MVNKDTLRKQVKFHGRKMSPRGQISLPENLKEKDDLGDTGVDRRSILK